jgi:hypothetical protein
MIGATCEFSGFEQPGVVRILEGNGSGMKKRREKEKKTEDCSRDS